MLSYKELNFVTGYLGGLQGRIDRHTTEDEIFLYKDGINKLTKRKYALLHDGKHPSSLNEVFKGKEFKDPNKRILFPYTHKDIVTHIGILCGGGVEVKPLCMHYGVFLGEDIKKTAHVCQTELEALLLRQLGVEDATVFTDPRALKYNNPTRITLVDAGGMSLEINEALKYHRTYENVNVLHLPDPLSVHKLKTNIDSLIEKSMYHFYIWLARKILTSFVENQDLLRYDLEKAELTDVEFDHIIELLEKNPRADIVVEWLKTIDRSTKTADVMSNKLRQNKDGWFIADDPMPLTNFRFVIERITTVKKVSQAVCAVFATNGNFTAELPVSRLCSRRPLNDILQPYITNTSGPIAILHSRKLPFNNINWMDIAQVFNNGNYATEDYTVLGVENFTELYNKIFDDTKWVSPTTVSEYSKAVRGSAIGYWHHETGDLWLNKKRLLKALSELSGYEITEATLDNCFGNNLDKRTCKARGTFYVFEESMLKKKAKIIEFRLA
jgi:hypothetical protein